MSDTVKRKCATLLATSAVALVFLSQAAKAYDTAAAQAAAAGVDCTLIAPFYWEIGDDHAGPTTDTTNVIVSGSVGGTARTTEYNIASSSKWLFGAYVLQKFGGVPSNAQVNDGLRMLTGYTHFNQTLCEPVQQVAGCYNLGHDPYPNHGYEAAADGTFFYSGGNDQYIGATQTLGTTSIANMTAAQLSTEVKSTLGLTANTNMSYQYPAIAGGMQSSAGEYAYFLQKIINGDYAISSLLGANPVDTQIVTGTAPNQTATCPSGLSGCSPAAGVGFHYSYNHWVEDNQSPGTITVPDLVTIGIGDGAFSSPGAYGFYPWISAGKQYYGIISRYGTTFGYEESLKCGQEIREAFLQE